MKKRNVLCRALALCAVSAALLFSSCSSMPDLAPVDPFDLLPSGAAVYLTVPVQANAEFVTAAIQKVAKVAESDAQKITERLDRAYIALGSHGELQLSASGNIPTSFVGLALSEKNGWKAGVVESQSVYTHQKTLYQLCLPSSSNAFLARDISPMIRRFNKIAYADFPVEKLTAEQSASLSSPEKLLSESLSERNYKFLHENVTADIKLYAPKPLSFISSFVGTDVQTGISSVYATLSQYRGVKDQFNVKLILNLSDERTVKATVALLKVAFFGGGVPAKVVQTAQNQITISDLPVSQKQILSLLQ